MCTTIRKFVTILLISILISVIAVIPPHILARARLNKHHGSRRTLLRENVQLYTYKSVLTFIPTVIKCCKLGEKMAKKKLSCHIHDPSRKMNMIHKIKSTYRIIVKKAEKCGVKYGQPFEKCCNYREDFYRDMHRCKINFTEREDRRKCRSLVRKKYT